MSPVDYCIVLCTVPRADARKIATPLISSGLAACVNRMPVHSHYMWEGEMVEDDEELLLIKTISARFEEILIIIKEIHPYELPEIIAVPLVNGDASYLAWLQEQTKHLYPTG